MVAADAGGAGVFEDWFAGLRPQGRIGSKDHVIPSTCGVINQMNGAAQFANTMSVLLAAGITINQAVDTTAKVMECTSERGCPLHARRNRAGRSLVECLRGKKYFRRRWSICIPSEKKTGELEETLDNVADYYTNEADYRIQRLRRFWNRRCWLCLRFLRVLL